MNPSEIAVFCWLEKEHKEEILQAKRNSESSSKDFLFFTLKIDAFSLLDNYPDIGNWILNGFQEKDKKVSLLFLSFCNYFE